MPTEGEEEEELIEEEMLRDDDEEPEPARTPRCRTQAPAQAVPVLVPMPPVPRAGTGDAGWGAWKQHDGWQMRPGNGLVSFRYRAPDGQEFDDETSAVRHASGAAAASAADGERSRKQRKSFNPSANNDRAQSAGSGAAAARRSATPQLADEAAVKKYLQLKDDLLEKDFRKAAARLSQEAANLPDAHERAAKEAEATNLREIAAGKWKHLAASKGCAKPAEDWNAAAEYYREAHMFELADRCISKAIDRSMSDKQRCSFHGNRAQLWDDAAMAAQSDDACKRALEKEIASWRHALNCLACLEDDDAKKRKQQIEVELRVAVRDLGLKRQVYQDFHRAAQLLKTSSLGDCKEALQLYLRALETHPERKFVREQIIECHVQLRYAEVEAESVKAGEQAVQYVTEGGTLAPAGFAQQQPAAFVAGDFILARYAQSVDFYEAAVESVSDDGSCVTVKWADGDQEHRQVQAAACVRCNRCDHVHEIFRHSHVKGTREEVSTDEWAGGAIRICSVLVLREQTRGVAKLLYEAVVRAGSDIADADWVQLARDGLVVIDACPSDYEELMYYRGKALYAKGMHAASIYCLNAAQSEQIGQAKLLLSKAYDASGDSRLAIDAAIGCVDEISAGLAMSSANNLAEAKLQLARLYHDASQSESSVKLCVEIAGLRGADVSNGVLKAAELLRTTLCKEEVKLNSLRDTCIYQGGAFVWTVGPGEIYQSRDNLYFGLQIHGKVTWYNFLKRGDHFPRTFRSGDSTKIELGGAGHNFKQLPKCSPGDTLDFTVYDGVDLARCKVRAESLDSSMCEGGEATAAADSHGGNGIPAAATVAMTSSAVSPAAAQRRAPKRSDPDDGMPAPPGDDRRKKQKREIPAADTVKQPSPPKQRHQLPQPQLQPQQQQHEHGGSPAELASTLAEAKAELVVQLPIAPAQHVVGTIKERLRHLEMEIVGEISAANFLARATSLEATIGIAAVAGASLTARLDAIEREAGV